MNKRAKIGYWFLWIVGNGTIGYQAYKYIAEKPMDKVDFVVFCLSVLMAYNVPTLKNTLGDLFKRKTNEL